MNVNEDPIVGLEREVKEETQLEVEILCPANTWFGRWRENWLLSIDYLVKRKTGTVRLSEEHSEYYWVSLSELEKEEPIQLNSNYGFQLEDFKQAFRLYNLFQGD